MSRQKLLRFEALKTVPNVLEEVDPVCKELKGNWQSTFFKNDHPITLELGCGRGEYTIGLAKVFPQRNFIGIDVKGDRLWIGSQQAITENLQNVAFLRALVQNVNDVFSNGEVDAIWITFPDPRPKGRDIKRRLTSPRFLDSYKQLLKPGGMIHFKTDNMPLFKYTLEVLAERTDIKDLESTTNLYQSVFMDEHHGIKTNFEQKFYDLGENIKYMKFRFDS